MEAMDGGASFGGKRNIARETELNRERERERD